MSFLSSLKMMFDGPGAVGKLIKSWKPGTLKNEKKYEDSLYDYLMEGLEGVDVVKQYGKGRLRADLVVNDNIIIELKHNMDSTGKHQRLVGQLDEYKQWEGPVFIVLCGKTDPNLLKKIKKYASDQGDLHGDMEDTYRVIVKGQ